jgi:uncharacterized Tic20 family protein
MNVAVGRLIEQVILMISSYIADILLSIGSLIGLFTKAHALKDKETVWNRKSSGLNVLTYPITALIPFYVLELYFTLTVSIANFIIWIGIFLFRNPKGDIN